MFVEFGPMTDFLSIEIKGHELNLLIIDKQIIINSKLDEISLLSRPRNTPTSPNVSTPKSLAKSTKDLHFRIRHLIAEIKPFS
jgi:hypothetical protein